MATPFSPILCFSAVRKELPFKRELANGTFEEYVLREPDGYARDEYLNGISRRMTTDTAGKTSLKNFKGLQASLLHYMVYRVGEETPVEEDVLQTWPASMLATLFEEAKKLAGLEDKKTTEEGPEKND